jgi:hypothetical protein
MTDAPEFAIVPLPPDGPFRAAIKSDAIAIGSKSAIMQHVIDTRQQRDLRFLVLRADAATRAEKAIEARRQADRDALIQNLCDGINKMQRRLDSYAEREALLAERDAQARQIIETYSIPADAYEGDHPDPSLEAEPGPRSADTGELPKPLLGNLPATEPELDPADPDNPQVGLQAPATTDL